MQQLEDCFSTAEIMPGALQSVQQQSKQFGRPRGRHDFLFEIVVAFQELESASARPFDLVEIFTQLFRCRKCFRQRPFKWIIPEVGRKAAEGLLDRGCAAKNLFAKRLSRT